MYFKRPPRKHLTESSVPPQSQEIIDLIVVCIKPTKNKIFMNAALHESLGKFCFSKVDMPAPLE
jgi:hypothetical protein